MKNKMTLLATTLVCLLPILLGLALYERLPAQIPSHFNGQGQPDSYLPKAMVVLGIPLIMAAGNLVVQFLLDNDPKRTNTPRLLRNILRWVMPVFSLVLVPLTLFISLGVQIPVSVVVPVLVGLLLVLMGNYLPKCRQNYTVGIKLPWTLNSEENWNRTHHLAGYLWIAGGVFVMVAGFLGLGIPAVLAAAVCMVVVPLLYSYTLYKKGV